MVGRTEGAPFGNHRSHRTNPVSEAPDTPRTPLPDTPTPPMSAMTSPSSQRAAGSTALPPRLAAIVDDFRAAPPELRIDFLIEYAEKLPPLPDDLAGHDAMERVVECQTPFFLAAQVADDGTAHLHFDAPAESPTTRAFAGILHEGLSGLPVREVLDVPDQFYDDMGLAESISALRLRGMAAIMARMKRQLRETDAA